MSKKTMSLLLTATLIIALLPAQLFAADASSDRLAGSDRIATALEICDAGWDSASTVILAAADQDNLVDSLAAASLAGQENAPILLNFKNKLDVSVRAKIQSLGAAKVYVIGAISDSVVSQLREISGLTVEKLSGSDRWATSDVINAKLSGVQGTFVVGYDAIPDALSVGAYAAANRYQIVLADAQGNVSSAKLAGTVYIIGGAGVVKDINGATRYGGADRYATNALVIKGLGYDFERCYVANGVTMVDALAASPLAGRYGAPIFLTNGTIVPALDNADVKNKVTTGSKIVALGGTGAVSQATLNAFGSGAGTGSGTITPNTPLTTTVPGESGGSSGGSSEGSSATTTPTTPTGQLNGIALGADLATVNSLLGAPYRSIDDNGAKLNFYGADYFDFALIKFKNDRTVFVYFVGQSHAGEKYSTYTDANDNNSVYAASVGDLSDVSINANEQIIFELTNAFRVFHAVPSLTWNTILAGTARAHSQDMAQNDYFNHTNLQGQSPGDRMNSAGYPNNLGAENIYAGQSNGVSAVAGWVNSAAHRNNILDPILQELGVGWALGGRYGTMATQNFGAQNGSYTPLPPADNSQDNSQNDTQGDSQNDSQYEDLEIPHTDDPLSYVETGKINVLVFGRATCLNTM